MILSPFFRVLSLIVVLLLIAGVFSSQHPEWSEKRGVYATALRVHAAANPASLPLSSPSQEQETSLTSQTFSGEVPFPEPENQEQTETTLGKNLLEDARFQQLLAKESTPDPELAHSLQGETLLQYFEKTKDPNLITPIVSAMLAQYRFISAKQFIQSLHPTQKAFLDPHLDLQVAFNAFQLSSPSVVADLQALLNHYAAMQVLSPEQLRRYQGIVLLMQGEYSSFLAQAEQWTTPAYRNFADTIKRLKTQVEQPGDQPAYYLDALVAVELFNQGFFYPAKVLALRALSQNVRYILPYQVLAYANFFTSSREAAIEYLSALKSLDEGKSEKYAFLMGVAYYRNQSYEASVLQLHQIAPTSPYA